MPLCNAIIVTLFYRRTCIYSIRHPGSDMALSFKGNYAGARVSLLNSWSFRVDDHTPEDYGTAHLRKTRCIAYCDRQQVGSRELLPEDRDPDGPRCIQQRSYSEIA